MKHQPKIGTVTISTAEYKELLAAQHELTNARKGDAYKVVYIGVTQLAGSKDFFFTDKQGVERAVELANEVAFRKIFIAKEIDKERQEEISKLKQKLKSKGFFHTLFSKE